MKKIFALTGFVLFCLAVTVPNIFGQDTGSEEITNEEMTNDSSKTSFSPVGFFAGIGPEINIYTRDGFAIGGTGLAGIDLNPQMSAGIRISFFNDLDTVSVLELQALYRYWLPWLKNLFVQAEAGMMFAFESDDTVSSFAGGASAGYRLNFSSNFFIDLSGRFGYPYMGAASIIAGIRFPKEDSSGTPRTPRPPRAPRVPRNRSTDTEQNDDAGEEDE